MRDPKDTTRNDSTPQTQINSPSNDAQWVPRNSVPGKLVPENPAPEKSATDEKKAQKTKPYRSKMVL